MGFQLSSEVSLSRRGLRTKLRIGRRGVACQRRFPLPLRLTFDGLAGGVSNSSRQVDPRRRQGQARLLFRGSARDVVANIMRGIPRSCTWNVVPGGEDNIDSSRPSKQTGVVPRRRSRTTVDERRDVQEADVENSQQTSR